MILNLLGKHNPLVFDRIQLNPYCSYKIRLISYNAVLSSKPSIGIYKLTTNLTERELGSSSRILAFFVIEDRSKIITFNPKSEIWFKLRLQDFSTAEVKLSSLTSDAELFFEEFSCQLEILETYGGL